MSDFPPIPYQFEGETDFSRAMRYWHQICKDAKRIEELERQLKECGEVLTLERSFNRDLVAHANATWQTVLKTTTPNPPPRMESSDRIF